MINEYGYIEETYLEVERLIGQEHYSDSRRLLEEMLNAEPGYGRAHNRLAWLYHTKLKAYTKAKNHYEYALRFSPEFPGTYLNYIQLLNEVNDWATLQKIAKVSFLVAGTQKDLIYLELGLSAEKNQKYAQASSCYHNAIRFTLDHHIILRCKDHIKRLKEKRKFSLRGFFTRNLRK